MMSRIQAPEHARDEVCALLKAAFHAAVRAAQPELALSQVMLEPAWTGSTRGTRGKTVVVGAGKAASSMAQAL